MDFADTEPAIFWVAPADVAGWMCNQPTHHERGALETVSNRPGESRRSADRLRLHTSGGRADRAARPISVAGGARESAGNVAGVSETVAQHVDAGAGCHQETPAARLGISPGTTRALRPSSYTFVGPNLQSTRSFEPGIRVQNVVLRRLLRALLTLRSRRSAGDMLASLERRISAPCLCGLGGAVSKDSPLDIGALGAAHQPTTDFAGISPARSSRASAATTRSAIRVGKI